MRYAQIRPFDVANGPGVRVSVFVTGCTHACPGCFNGLYQDFTYGDLWTDETTTELIELVQNPVISGLTLLGGEPMQNLELKDVIQTLRQVCNKPIWIYSGYTFEQILADEDKKSLLVLCDVLVDGLFIQAKKDLTLKFRGSSNQRIIDIKRSLASGDVCCLDD